MKVETTRFGQVEIKDEEVYYFPEGLLGFNSIKNYFTIKNPGGGPFLWLQAVQPPNLAFVICDPLLFKQDYKIEIRKEDLEAIELEDVTKGLVFVILVVPKDRPEDMTANI